MCFLYCNISTCHSVFIIQNMFLLCIYIYICILCNFWWNYIDIHCWSEYVQGLIGSWNHSSSQLSMRKHLDPQISNMLGHGVLNLRVVKRIDHPLVIASCLELLWVGEIHNLWFVRWSILKAAVDHEKTEPWNKPPGATWEVTNHPIPWWLVTSRFFKLDEFIPFNVFWGLVGNSIMIISPGLFQHI